MMTLQSLITTQPLTRRSRACLRATQKGHQAPTHTYTEVESRDPKAIQIHPSLFSLQIYKGFRPAEMMQLLYTAIFSQMALILTLLFKSPLRKLVILGLDKLKRGKGPVVVKTVGGTVAAVLFANVYNLNELKSRTNEAGMLNPTDEVLMSMKLLEISLMGFFLFLSLMIDRLHHYIRELRFLRKAMEAAKKQNQTTQEEKNEGHKTLVQENETLRAKVKNLESEHETKEKKAKAAGAEVQALKKQSEGLLLEYDRLLEENQHLRDQLKSIDRSMSHSDDKKKT